MLLISGSIDLMKITCISSLCSIDKLSFYLFSIFSFFLQLPISSVLQIIKEMCSSSSYSFHFRHLSFNGIMKTISSQNMTSQIAFSMQDIIQKCLFSPLRSRTCSLDIFSEHFIFSIFLPAHFKDFQILPLQFSYCRGLQSCVAKLQT